MKRRVGVVLVVLSLLALTFCATAQPNQAWIPGVASFAIPGFGQLLNDQADKAITHFVIDLGIWAVYLTTARILPPLAIAMPVALLGWRGYSAYDAYTVAKDRGFTIGVAENGFAFSYSYSF
jgi:hypothetical protein